MMYHEITDKEKRIIKAEKLYNDQKAIAERATKLQELAMDDLCDAIKDYTTVYDYGIDIIHKAADELRITDKRRKKKSLEWLNSVISKDFFDDKVNIKIESVTWCGLHTQSVKVQFTLKNKSCVIYIPFKNNLDYEYEQFNYGKFAFGIMKNPSYCECLISSYFIDEVRDYIINLFMEEENNA